MATRKSRKSINFDLGTNELKSFFGTDTRPAYRAIRKFLETRGFEHRQYSGYFSLKPMESAEIINILEDMNIEFPWMRSCLQQIDITNIDRFTDARYIFEAVEPILVSPDPID